MDDQRHLVLIGMMGVGKSSVGRRVALRLGRQFLDTDKLVEEMSPAPGATAKPLRQPRPGHADLAGMQKYGFDDARDVLERASARETAARVAAGTLAKALLSHLGISVLSHVIQIGSARAAGYPAGAPGSGLRRPTPADLEAVDASEVRCFDPASEQAMITEIKEAAKAGDSLPATPWAAWSRCSATAYPPASDRTCTGIGASTG